VEEDTMNQDQQEKKKYDNAPIIESFVSLSKDGSKVIHRTVITDIRARLYYEKMFGDEEVTQ
jgi:hypothetical protein